jgi:hypothetical protein
MSRDAGYFKLKHLSLKLYRRRTASRETLGSGPLRKSRHVQYGLVILAILAGSIEGAGA